MNKNDTCIIFGTSPFISKICKEDMDRLLNNYTTVGINLFPVLFNNVDYWIWADYNAYKTCYQYHIKDSHKIITSEEVYNRELKNKNLNIEYVFDGHIDVAHDITKNKLLMFKTSVHPAINYMYLKGFKNILLCGIDLTENWNHFYGLGDIVRTPVRIRQIRDRLYEFKKYVNLYNINCESDLEIQPIYIKEL
jgi:hypothetical protein